jgi:hypothetical protein
MKFLKTTGDPDIDEVASKLRNWVLSISWVCVSVIIAMKLNKLLGIDNFVSRFLAAVLVTFMLFPLALFIFCKINNRTIGK